MTDILVMLCITQAALAAMFLGNTEDDRYFNDVIYHTGCGSCGAGQYKGPSSPGRPGQCGVQSVKEYRYRLHQQHQNPRHQINDVLWGSGNH